jgi:hypothetical protein
MNFDQIMEEKIKKETRLIPELNNKYQQKNLRDFFYGVFVKIIENPPLKIITQKKGVFLGIVQGEIGVDEVRHEESAPYISRDFCLIECDENFALITPIIVAPNSNYSCLTVKKHIVQLPLVFNIWAIQDDLVADLQNILRLCRDQNVKLSFNSGELNVPNHQLNIRHHTKFIKKKEVVVPYLHLRDGELEISISKVDKINILDIAHPICRINIDKNFFMLLLSLNGESTWKCYSENLQDDR